MTNRVRIAIVGDFNPEYRSHVATGTALRDAVEAAGAPVEPEWMATPRLEGNGGAVLRDYDGLLIAPGSPYCSMAGAFDAIRFARTERRPLIGN